VRDGSGLTCRIFGFLCQSAICQQSFIKVINLSESQKFPLQFIRRGYPLTNRAYFVSPHLPLLYLGPTSMSTKPRKPSLEKENQRLRDTLHQRSQFYDGAGQVLCTNFALLSTIEDITLASFAIFLSEQAFSFNFHRTQ
jgi:hypothetical protein